MPPVALDQVTWAEYVAHERQAERKSEFVDGEVREMTGATEAHNLITLNVANTARQALSGGQCRTYACDMRVRCPDGLGTYPDVAIACDPQFEDDRRDTLLNPVVIVEVLSPSTAAYDRGEKFQSYGTLPSLREYLLIAQDNCFIQHYVRQGETDRWLLTTLDDLTSTLRLTSIDVSIGLDQVYVEIILP